MLMHCLLMSPEHQQAWYYWLCKTDNLYCCSRVNVIYLDQPNRRYDSKCEYIFLILKTIQYVKNLKSGFQTHISLQ